ncbi:hypothetical protein PHPALM_29537 [Phytophthora palmivora]|uniref:Uncharacterized protein n=1 Tax=Phytophthora palmivora TaxID=4796 RepID=A0A2P4X7B1_9STRA|nr:hypothetical protein PHPALM_29537 [Phytophthora palmivora]
MARADDDEALRRRGRARTRAPPPTSIANMYAPVDASNRQEPAPRSSKMKMASLMVDESDVDESKHKRVKVNDQDADDWAPRNTSLSISSLVEDPPASSLFQNEMPTIIQSFSDERRASQAAVNGESKNGVVNGDAMDDEEMTWQLQKWIY